MRAIGGFSSTAPANKKSAKQLLISKWLKAQQNEHLQKCIKTKNFIRL